MRKYCFFVLKTWIRQLRHGNSGPIHSWDWEPVTITLRAHSLVEKVEPVKVRFTLRLTYQRSVWMQDGCKVYMDSYMASNGFVFHGHLDYFRKLLLGGRPNTNPGDHGTPNAHNCCFIIFYHVWEPAWIEIAFGWRSGNIWLHTTLEDPWPHYMNLEVCWDGLWTLSFGLSQFHGHGSWLVCEVALTDSKLCLRERERKLLHTTILPIHPT